MDKILTIFNQHKVILFTKSKCFECEKAKILLQKAEIPYFEYVIDMDQEMNVYKSLIAMGAVKNSFPYLCIGSIYIGGLNELESVIASGELSKLTNNEPKSIHLGEKLIPIVKNERN